MFSPSEGSGRHMSVTAMIKAHIVGFRRMPTKLNIMITFHVEVYLRISLAGRVWLTSSIQQTGGDKNINGGRGGGGFGFSLNPTQ